MDQVEQLKNQYMQILPVQRKLVQQNKQWVKGQKNRRKQMKSWKQINPKYIFGFKFRVVWNLKPGCITTATHAFLLRSGPCSRCHGKVLASKQPATSYTHSEMLPTMSWDGKWPSVGITCVNASCMLFKILFHKFGQVFCCDRCEWIFTTCHNQNFPKIIHNKPLDYLHWIESVKVEARCISRPRWTPKEPDTTKLCRNVLSSMRKAIADTPWRNSTTTSDARKLSLYLWTCLNHSSVICQRFIHRVGTCWDHVASFWKLPKIPLHLHHTGKVVFAAEWLDTPSPWSGPTKPWLQGISVELVTSLAVKQWVYFSPFHIYIYNMI